MPARTSSSAAAASVPPAGLPPVGAPTIAHNIAVFAAQDSAARHMHEADRRDAVLRRLIVARTLRAASSDIVVWHGELGDLDTFVGLLDPSAVTAEDRRPMVQRA